MVSDLENLSATLTKTSNCKTDEGEWLAEKIKSDPRIQSELERTGKADVQDDAGRSFVVRRKVATATTAASG